MHRRPGLAVLLLFVVLAIIHTWPLATAPGRLGRNGQADTQLNIWTMAWVAHQVIRDPVHLFDANIFYPERRTLAFSEHLFVQAMMGAPLRWAGGSPVLVYNVVFIAGMALTGWTMALVMQRWTGNWWASVLSGSLMAFNATTLTRFPHIQSQHLEFLPLALLTLDRLLATARTKYALQLVAWYVMQSLTSLYFLVFTAIVLLASALARPREWLGQRARAVLPKLLLSAAVAIVVLLPFLLPYVLARREQEMFVRTLDETAKFSARWTDYLATGGSLHNATWSGKFFRGDGLFPGVVGISLTAIAIASGIAFSDRRARMALVFGIVCFCLSFGPTFPLYSYLYQAFPAMAAVRGAARFGQMVLTAVAILAGFGLVAVQRRLPASWVVPFGAALVIMAHVEALRAPIDFGRDHVFGGIAPIFSALDTPDPQVVVIFPFYPRHTLFMNARYMIASTAFWKPMLNGYSGYMPTRYIEHTENLSAFPDRRSVNYLQGLGVTRVLVDSRNMSRASLDDLPSFPELRLMATDGNLRIYALPRVAER